MRLMPYGPATETLLCDKQNLMNFMKRFTQSLLVLMMVLFVALQGCKKDKDVEPQALSEQVAGDYQLTYLKIGASQFPMSQFSGGIKARKSSDNQVALSFTLTNKQNNQSAGDELGTVELVEKSGKISMQLQGQEVGSYQNGTIEIIVEDSAGDEIVMRAKK